MRNTRSALLLLLSFIFMVAACGAFGASEKRDDQNGPKSTKTPTSTEETTTAGNGSSGGGHSSSGGSDAGKSTTYQPAGGSDSPDTAEPPPTSAYDGDFGGDAELSDDGGPSWAEKRRQKAEDEARQDPTPENNKDTAIVFIEPKDNVKSGGDFGGDEGDPDGDFSFSDGGDAGAGESARKADENKKAKEVKGATTTKTTEGGSGGSEGGAGAIDSISTDQDADVSEIFFASRKIEVAEDWGTSFQSIAHNIGPVYTHPGRLPHFTINRIGNENVETYIRDHVVELGVSGELELPLEHTHVDAHLVGPVARVHLQQRFNNPYDKVIEAVYVFPLPENSAVDGMKMVIGERVDRGSHQEEAREAGQMYEDAQEGCQGTPPRCSSRSARTSSHSRSPTLLRRPPSTSRPATCRTSPTSRAQYEFVFPMVVGPRYVARRRRRPTLCASTHQCWAAATRSGHDISLSSVSADGGRAHAEDYEVPTHHDRGQARQSSGRLSSLRLSDGGLAPEPRLRPAISSVAQDASAELSPSLSPRRSTVARASSP